MLAAECFDYSGTSPAHVPRWWNTLAFRMAFLINATVIVVLGTAEAINFTKERTVVLSQEFEKLREEANVLAVARKRLAGRSEYQQFLDDFCQQMSTVASPGHHILVLDPDGMISLRAHARADPGLEERMMAAIRGSAPVTAFTHQGGVYLVASAATDTARSIVVAQSLEPMLDFIRKRAIGRLIGVGGLALLIFVVTGIGLWYWVRRPLRYLVHVVDLVGKGHFQTRAQGIGSAEVRFLAGGINSMARSLGRVEDARRAEMERARKIQQRLLPSRETRLKGLQLAAAFVPTSIVGGDLFDCVELTDGSVVLAVIDVSGHGVPAALYTALLRTVLRYEMDRSAGLDDLLARTNRQLRAVSDMEDFATCFVALVEPDRNRLQFAKAGHDPALLLHPDASVVPLDTDGLPLGVSLGIRFQSAAVPFHTGDRLVLYTDGLHEVRDAHGAPFGRERLMRLAVDTLMYPPGEQVRRIIEAVQDFQQSQIFGDDVTLVCLQRD